jgi:hypothetical protein
MPVSHPHMKQVPTRRPPIRLGSSRPFASPSRFTDCFVELAKDYLEQMSKGPQHCEVLGNPRTRLFGPVRWDALARNPAGGLAAG